MKQFAIPALLVSVILAGCKTDDESNKYIRPDKTEMSIILGTESYLNIAFNTTGFTHKIDNEGITTLKGTEKHDKGNITLILKGQKLGTTQIHLMEGMTNGYESVVNINCKNISGEWIEWCEDLDPEEQIQTQVVVSDAQIKSKIEKEVRDEAYMRFNTIYDFSDKDMTFTLTPPPYSETFQGTYEQENNMITLHYENKTEKFFIINDPRSHYIYFDYTDKYKELYPDAEVHTVSCRRCLSFPKRK